MPANEIIIDNILGTLEKLAQGLQQERRERERLASDVAALRVELGVQRGIAELTRRLDALAGGEAEGKAGGEPGTVVSIVR